MKKVVEPRPTPPRRAGYDFSQGERGKYAARYAAGVRLPKEPGFPTRLKYWIEDRLYAWRHRHSA